MTVSLGRKAEFGDFVQEFRDLLVAHSGFLFAAVAIITATFVAWELLISQTSEFVVQLTVTIVGQFLVTERLLADRLPEGRGYRRFGSIFGSGLAGGFVIGIGLLLLIVPGIYLVGRLSAAVPIIVAENCPAIESLRASWDRTEQSKLPVFLLYVAAMVIWAGSIGLVLYLGTVDLGQAATAALVVLNLVVSVVTVLGWALAAAVYRQITPTTSGLDEVFA